MELRCPKCKSPNLNFIDLASIGIGFFDDEDSYLYTCEDCNYEFSQDEIPFEICLEEVQND